MAEFLLKCKCGQMRMYQKYIKGVSNKKHWIIECKNCNAMVETVKYEKAVDLWNTWDFYHENKIHSEVQDENTIQSV